MRPIAAGAAAAVAAAAIAWTAAPARAGLLDPVLNVVIPSCGPESQPFAPFRDTNSYYAIPNNGFEHGSSGWSLGNGARVVYGNEPYEINGPGSYSLSLPSGSSALSPAACINLLSPYLRLVAQDANGADRGLSAQVLFYGLAGNLLGIVNAATFDPSNYRTWQPSDRVGSALAVPLATSYFRLLLAPDGWGSAWRVDDVFVDPWVIGAG